MELKEIEQLIRKTRGYEFADGLRDMQLAVLLAASGATVWLSLNPAWIGWIFKMRVQYGRWAALLGMLPVVLGPLAAWAALGLMKIIRRRWLWRESGEVKPLFQAVPGRVQLISALILVGGLAAGFALRSAGVAGDAFILKMLWAATGWSFGYTLFGLGRHLGIPRYIRLGAAGGLLSTAVLPLPLTFSEAALAVSMGWAVLLTISGAATLLKALPGTGRTS